MIIYAYEKAAVMGIKPIRQPFIRLINGDFGKSKEQNQKGFESMTEIFGKIIVRCCKMTEKRSFCA